jgi:hypothetical protein
MDLHMDLEHAQHHLPPLALPAHMHSFLDSHAMARWPQSVRRHRVFKGGRHSDGKARSKQRLTWPWQRQRRRAPPTHGGKDLRADKSGGA